MTYPHATPLGASMDIPPRITPPSAFGLWFFLLSLEGDTTKRGAGRAPFAFRTPLITGPQEDARAPKWVIFYDISGPA